LVPGLSVTQAGPPGAIGDGNATVATVAVDGGNVAITRGRFGTDVDYVRVPDASVRLAGVDGTPRLVYRLRIPALGVDHSATKLIDGPGRVTIRLSDVAIRPQRVTNDSYRGRLTVRVQSYTVDRVVHNESLSIEVGR
ncbi:MAG: hypothetical protein ABEI57_01410, partial [Halapricum sp.]